jgi:pheromone shutdown-related protein TraB
VTDTTDAAVEPTVPASEPIRRVHRDGTEFVLLGTAHVSKASVAAVERIVAAETFDAVAVELCPHRADVIQRPDAVQSMDLFHVIREGRAAVVAAGLALGAYQRRIAQQFGIEPGAEMKAALGAAEAHCIPAWLIDRDVGVTLRRTRAAVGFWERAKITGGLIASLIDDAEIEEADVERLKQGDILESAFTEFAKSSPPLFEALIAERDRYMAARLREEAARSRPSRVLAVVGAGHLDGLAKALADETRAPAEVLDPITAEPPESNVGTYFTIAIFLFVFGGFAWGFAQGAHVGLGMVGIWVLSTGIGGAIGALAAGAHPLSIAAAFVASPLTTLHPALASGMASAAVELWARKPTVGDFQRLKDDVGTLRGWWKNRVARTFVVFFLTSLGTAIGVWVAGFRMAAAMATG